MGKLRSLAKHHRSDLLMVKVYDLAWHNVICKEDGILRKTLAEAHHIPGQGTDI